MNQTSEHFFADARLAGNENRYVRPRNHLRNVGSAQHLRTGECGFSRKIRSCTFGLVVLMPLKGVFDRELRLLSVEWSDQIIVGTHLYRFDDQANLCCRRGHDYRYGAVCFSNACQKLQCCRA